MGSIPAFKPWQYLSPYFLPIEMGHFFLSSQQGKIAIEVFLSFIVKVFHFLHGWFMNSEKTNFPVWPLSERSHHATSLLQASTTSLTGGAPISLHLSSNNDPIPEEFKSTLPSRLVLLPEISLC